MRERGWVLEWCARWEMRIRSSNFFIQKAKEKAEMKTQSASEIQAEEALGGLEVKTDIWGGARRKWLDIEVVYEAQDLCFNLEFKGQGGGRKVGQPA